MATRKADQGDHPFRGPGAAAGLLDLAAADAALDRAGDLRRRVPDHLAGLGVERGQHLVVGAAVHRHLRQQDPVALDREARAVLETRAHAVVAEFGHHHADDLAVREGDRDAGLLVVQDRVAVLVDVRLAVVLDPQQHQRRVDERLAQLIEDTRVVGLDHIGGRGVHLHPIAQALASLDDELIERRDPRDDHAQGRERHAPPELDDRLRTRYAEGLSSRYREWPAGRAEDSGNVHLRRGGGRSPPCRGWWPRCRGSRRRTGCGGPGRPGGRRCAGP